MISSRRRGICAISLGIGLLLTSSGYAEIPKDRALDVERVPLIESARVRMFENLDLLVFELELNGNPLTAVPQARGTLDTAPVFGYVFPTNLKPSVVGFNEAHGILALAITTHPDFDDTPLWDEDSDSNYSNDGAIYHPHWVVLHPDKRVEGGLSVVPAEKDRLNELLPPTHPGMPMYMDSPGHSVVLTESSIRVLVPAGRIGGERQFKFDAVSCYMEVNASDSNRPMLGVYEVYQVLSGDLSLPYSVGD